MEAVKRDPGDEVDCPRPNTPDRLLENLRIASYSKIDGGYEKISKNTVNLQNFLARS